MSDKNLFDKVGEVINDPVKLQQFHDDTSLPDSLMKWLNKLKLLYGVPFDYLVPNAKMLPPESISFFQVDYNWLYALVEGALSIGRSTSSDSLHDSVILPSVHKSLFKLGDADSLGSARAPKISGFLLRSQVVKGWPGLEVVPYDGDDNILTERYRMERLTPNLLLYMVEGVIESVDFKEPPEGMHFGFDPVEQEQSAIEKRLRYVTVPGSAPAGTVPGMEITPAVEQSATVRGTTRAIKINALAGLIKASLTANSANESGKFTSAEFALELTEGASIVHFKKAN